MPLHKPGVLFLSFTLERIGAGQAKLHTRADGEGELNPFRPARRCGMGILPGVIWPPFLMHGMHGIFRTQGVFKEAVEAGRCSGEPLWAACAGGLD